MSSPRISVVIPTRNRLEKLRRALAAVDGQTFRDFEVWIVDDCSSDGTAQFLRQGAVREDYPGIPSLHVLFNDRPVGAAAARNQAMNRAGGEMIAFLDDDDVWLPEYLTRQISTLDSHPDACASYAVCTEVDQEGHQRLPDLRPLFRYDSQLIHLVTESFVHTLSVFACRRKALEHVGPLNDRLLIVHDLDWYARLLMSGGTIIPVPGDAIVRREMPGGLVAGHREWFEEEQTVLSRLFRESRECARREGHVRAHRALLFARLSISHKDYSFAARRLIEAFQADPVRCMQIIFVRVLRNLRAGALQQDGSNREWSSVQP